MIEQALAEFVFRHRTFPRPAEAEGVNQGEQIVKRRVATDRMRHTGVERLHGSALHLAVGIGPYRRNLLPGADFSDQGGGCPCGRQSAGYFSGTGWKDIGHAMNQKITQSFTPDFLGLGIEQPRFAQPTHGGMGLRSTYTEVGREFRIAWPRRSQCEFERNNDVLWLGKH